MNDRKLRRVEHEIRHGNYELAHRIVRNEQSAREMYHAEMRQIEAENDRARLDRELDLSEHEEC